MDGIACCRYVVRILSLVGPRQRFACASERRTLCVDRAQVCAETSRKFVGQILALISQIVAFGYVVAYVIQLFFARDVVVYELVVVEAYGCVEVDARALHSPVIGKIPVERTVSRGVGSAVDQRHEADAVDPLSVRTDGVGAQSGHFHYRRVEVFDHHVARLDGAWFGASRPADDHGFAYAPFEQGAFS